MSERKDMPVSLITVPLAGLAFLVQTIPIIGVFTMILMGPAWPMALIYAGAAWTVLDVVRGRISPWWLLLPIVPLLAYEAIALQQHRVVWRLSHEAAAANSRVVIPFDLKNDQLVLRRDANARIPFEPVRLVADHALPVVFEGPIVGSDRSRSFISHRVGRKDQCEALRVQSGGILDRIDDGSSLWSHRLDHRVCHATLTEDPRPLAMTVSFRTAFTVTDHVPVERTEATITRFRSRALPLHKVGEGVAPAPDRLEARISSGVARPLSWAPIFLAGCGLNSSNPSWDCGFTFIRDRIAFPDDGGHGAQDALAKALGLRWTGREGRIIPSDPSMDARISALNAERSEAAVVVAKGMMDGRIPARRSGDLEGLLYDDAKLIALAPAIVRFVDENVAPEPGAWRRTPCAERPDVPDDICREAVRRRTRDARDLLAVLSTARNRALVGFEQDIDRLQAKDSDHRRAVQTRRQRSRMMRRMAHSLGTATAEGMEP